LVAVARVSLQKDFAARKWAVGSTNLMVVAFHHSRGILILLEPSQHKDVLIF
jgi:hypothetical protein